MHIDFTGKLVLVAGGTGGLGRAVALAFLAEGANVAVTYRDASEFEALVEAAGPGAALTGHTVDVTDPAAVEELIASLVAERYRIDCLVSAVGGYAGGETLWQQQPETLDRMFALNFRASYTLTRAVLSPMLKEHAGAIITVSSRAAYDHGARASAYSASKAAELAMMESVAKELNGTGVRINSVVPSIIDTPANRKAMPDANHDTWPRPEEIARVIVFLASDAATVVNGAAVPVYGSR
jgi:NAD(P)-dependent dehydrogenase (short-subunit alcohol dehydrogenase family)